MTDIFFSYSSKDRDRVRPIHATLAEYGFNIFWDQSVPPGTDWDTWIRQHLNDAKCAIVFWSENSVRSDNVRHEATVAKQQSKLIPVLLDPIGADQFPMGHYAVQGANLTGWSGEPQDERWLKLQREVESKLTPLWVRRMIDGLEAELVAERARRDSVERRDRTLREQITKEVQAQQELRRERNEALDDLAALKLQLESAERVKSKQSDRAEATELELKTPEVRSRETVDPAARMAVSSQTRRSIAAPVAKAPGTAPTGESLPALPRWLQRES